MLSKVLCFHQFENWIYLVFEVFLNFYCNSTLWITFQRWVKFSFPFLGSPTTNPSPPGNPCIGKECLKWLCFACWYRITDSKLTGTRTQCLREVSPLLIAKIKKDGKNCINFVSDQEVIDTWCLVLKRRLWVGCEWLENMHVAMTANTC